MNLLLIFIGGGLGSLARYGCGRWLNPEGEGMAWGTLLANAAACLILGLTAGWLSRQVPADTTLRLAVITGFCGGFSTFSTFSMELLQALEQGAWLRAGSYLGLSLAACLLAVWAGKWAMSA